MSNWKIISGHLQGDITYSLQKTLVTPDYIDFELTAFGEKWNNFDIAFEYRYDEREMWMEDAVITQTTAKYLRGNKLYGLSASKDGVVHTIRWKYSENNLLYGTIPQIKIRFLPRLRVFGSTGTYNSISSVYGDSLIDLDKISTRKCIGIDNSGRYMCVSSTAFYIMEDLAGSILYTYALNNPNFAIQINSGNYIISDYGNNLVVELDSSLVFVRNFGSGAGVVYFDYSEENETLLVTSNLGTVKEYTWSAYSYGDLLWTLPCSLNNPQSATYKQDDVTKIIIADMDNNRIVKYDRNSNLCSYLYNYRLNDADIGPFEIANYYNPFRAFWYKGGEIGVVEKEGRELNWQTLESSSSSSSSA